MLQDNPINRKIIAAQLKSLGYTFVLVTDSQMLFDQLDQTDYDLIMMDCQMPLLDVYEATRHIRESDRHRSACIYAFWATVSKMERHMCLEAGMDGFLRKPVRVSELKKGVGCCGAILAGSWEGIQQHIIT